MELAQTQHPCTEDFTVQVDRGDRGWEKNWSGLHVFPQKKCWDPVSFTQSLPNPTVHSALSLRLE